MQNQQQETGFFTGLRNLGIYRGQGWIGGVSGAYANRMNIDVTIVRGIFVIGALIGLPMVIIYAASWLLLPDLNGRILLEQVVRGRWEPPVFGALLLVILGVIAIGVASLIFGRIFGFVGGVLLFFAVLGFGIWALVWALNRRKPPKVKQRYEPQNPYAQSGTYAPGAYVAGAYVTGPDTAGAYGAAPETVSDPNQSPSTPAPSTQVPLTDEQLYWQNEQARQQSEAAQREAQQKMEHRMAKQRFRMEQNEVRRRQMEEYERKNPRISGSELFVCLGAAFLLAGILGLSIPEFGLVGAFATGLGVLALGMIITGFRSRKSALLAFFAVINVFALGITILVSGVNVDTRGTHWYQKVDFSKSDEMYQFAGTTTVDLHDTLTADGLIPPGHTFKLNQFMGAVYLQYAIDSELTIQLDFTQGLGQLYTLWQSEDWSEELESQIFREVPRTNSGRSNGKLKTYIIGPNKTPDYYLVINQTFGDARLEFSAKSFHNLSDVDSKQDELETSDAGN